MSELTQKKLKELLHYNPDTGLFVWLTDRGTNKVKGKVAGWLKKEYISLTLLGESRVAHRLAWLYMTGDWPENMIDHVNGIKDDNRWLNLREATHAQNARNRRLNKNSKSGYKGVHWHKSSETWRVQIRVNNERIYLGHYKDIQKAHLAYCKGARKYHGKFANTGLS